jgi:DNA-binding IclR family transcriptional regulator
MGENIITDTQKKVLELLAAHGMGLTIKEIHDHNTKKKLGIPAGDLDTVVEELVSLRFLRSEAGDPKRYYITIHGMNVAGKGTGPPWP